MLLFAEKTKSFNFLLPPDEPPTPGAEGQSEKVPVENSDQPSDAASTSEQPQQALSLVCDE